MARTMAEAGTLCPGCTHPFGRHEFEPGCVAVVDGRRCACVRRPGDTVVTVDAMLSVVE